jgi:hypothetical protein
MTDDPREAVLESLCAPPKAAVRQGTPKGRVGKGWVVGGIRPSADRQTVVFKKERAGVTTRIYAVSYSDTAGRQHFDVVGAAQGADGSWTAGGSAGGSGNGPVRDRPWVNFGGWWGNDLFCAGGTVMGTGSEQAKRVRLSFADEAAIEDTVDDGVVLFLIERGVQLPATAEIFDANSTLLSSHEFPGIG